MSEGKVLMDECPICKHLTGAFDFCSQCGIPVSVNWRTVELDLETNTIRYIETKTRATSDAGGGGGK